MGKRSSLKYPVIKCDVSRAFRKHGIHAKSIFGKEYQKIQDMNIRLANEPDKEKSLNGMSQENVSVDDLEKLMFKDEFNIDDNRFSEESLNLLESEDCLRLLEKACE